MENFWIIFHDKIRDKFKNRALNLSFQKIYDEIHCAVDNNIRFQVGVKIEDVMEQKIQEQNEKHSK